MQLDQDTSVAVLIVSSEKHGTFHIKIDAEDWDRVNRHRWAVLPAGTQGRVYFRTTVYEGGGQRMLYLHRFIMNAPDGQDVDHRHFDYLDLRKSQLRLATEGQNTQSRRKWSTRATSSRFKGVSRAPRGWYAYITSKGKRISKSFPDGPCAEIKAARWYNRKAHELFGEFAHPNLIPDSDCVTA
jgi:hypothetical protein